MLIVDVSKERWIGRRVLYTLMFQHVGLHIYEGHIWKTCTAHMYDTTCSKHAWNILSVQGPFSQFIVIFQSYLKYLENLDILSEFRFLISGLA